jgi:hypothetical protein
MNKRSIYLIVPAILSLGTAFSAMARDMNHDNCGGTTTISVENMGAVNETTLQQHIDAIQNELNNHYTHSNGWTDRQAKSHLVRMQNDMMQLHDKMVANGCSGALHGSSLETRVSALENGQGK